MKRAWGPQGNWPIWPSVLLRFWHRVDSWPPPGILGETMGVAVFWPPLCLPPLSHPYKGHPSGKARIPEDPCKRQMDHLATHPALPGCRKVLAALRSWREDRPGYRGKGEQGIGWGEEGKDRRDLGEIFKLKKLPRAVLLSDWFQAIAALALP